MTYFAKTTMEATTLLGYAGALMIGVVLGLTGGGGSILTLPILVYLLDINPILATSYSLFIVGTSALVGATKNAFKGMVDFKTGIVFAIPALLAVYLNRTFLIPALPDVLFTVGNHQVTKNVGIMVFFAIIMLMAAYSMIKGRKESSEIISDTQFKYPQIIFQGLLVGTVTGIVGAGGGFLIIPALVLLLKLPMKKAVATSLMIIAINSLLGFTGDLQTLTIDWSFLLIFTAISVMGMFVGIYLNNFIDGKKLKKGFGWFVLVMGIYIILKETIL